MKRLLPLLLIALPLSAAPARRYIITTHPAENKLSAHILDDSDGVRIHAARELSIINGFAADLTAEEVAALKQFPEVRFIEPVIERHAFDIEPAFVPHVSNSPLAHAQTVPYGIDLIRARELWPLARGANVNVVIFDTGITANHPDLAANIAGGY